MVENQNLSRNSGKHHHFLQWWMFTGRWYCILTVSMSKTYVQSSFTSPQRLHFIILIYFIRRTQLQSYHPFFKLFLLPHSESMWAHLRHHRHFEKVIPPHEAIAMTKITSTSNPPKSGRISMNLWVCFGGGSSAINRAPTYCQQFMNNTSNL